MTLGGFKLDLIKLLNILGISRDFDGNIVFLSLTQCATETLSGASKDFVFTFFEI